MAEVAGGPMGLLKRGWLLKGFKFQCERNNLVFWGGLFCAFESFIWHVSCIQIKKERGGNKRILNGEVGPKKLSLLGPLHHLFIVYSRRRENVIKEGLVELVRGYFV